MKIRSIFASHWLPYWAMVLHTMVISPGYSFGKWASLAFPIPLLTSLRLWASLGIYLILALFIYFIKGKNIFAEFPTDQQTRKRIIILALIGATFNQLLFVLGLKYASPAQSALIFALTPLVVTLMAVHIVKSEKWTLSKLLAIILALVGVVIVILGNGSHFNFTVNNENATGMLLTFISVALWAGYMTLSRMWVQNIPPFVFTSVLSLVGAVIMTPLGLAYIFTTDLTHISAKAWFGFAYLSIISSALAYLLMTYALSRINASKVSIFMNIQPVVVVMISVFLGFDTLHLPLIIGGLCILAGVYLLNKVRK